MSKLTKAARGPFVLELFENQGFTYLSLEK